MRRNEARSTSFRWHAAGASYVSCLKGVRGRHQQVKGEQRHEEFPRSGHFVLEGHGARGVLPDLLGSRQVEAVRRREAERGPAQAQDALDGVLSAEHPHAPSDRGRHAPPRRPRTGLLGRQDDRVPATSTRRPSRTPSTCSSTTATSSRCATSSRARRTRRQSGPRSRSSTVATDGASTRPRCSPTCTRSGSKRVILTA